MSALHTVSGKLALSGACVAMSLSYTAWGSGFALQEQNTSGLGNAYAGSVAVAEDASTLFFNAAGLTQLKSPSIVVNVSGIHIDSKFHNTGSQAAALQSLGGEGGNAGGITVLPALYFAMPVSDNISAGVGINAPFGLKTEYEADWAGRFQALKSEVITTNFNTALAFKLGSMFSLGLGLDYQTISAELTKAVNYSAIVARETSNTVLVPGLAGVTRVKGDDGAWGYDVGLLFTPTEATHIGLSYRSAMKYHITGDVSFTTPTTDDLTAAFIISAARAGQLADGPVQLDLELPASARVGFTQQFGPMFQLLAEASWTQWSKIPELLILRGDGSELSVTPEQWEDTWRYALGGTFTLGEAWKLRVGAALDESPVPDSTRTPRLPDNDRMWYSVGTQWKPAPNWAFDLGYTYIKADNASLNQNDGSTDAYGLLNGEHRSKINILGAQATVSF